MTLLSPLRGGDFTRRKNSAIITIPPPLEGWVSENDPRSENLTSARILTNIIPRRVFSESRNGYHPVADTETAGIIETLMSYQSGSDKKLLAAVGGSIYSCPTSPVEPPPAATELQSGFSNSLFQSVMMANAADEMRLIMVNGEDGIWTYEPTGGVVKETPTPDQLSLLDVTSFKGRLWFTETGTTTLWYADPLSNQPATLTPFYVGGLLKRGGDCIAIDSMSLDGGSGPDDYLVIATNIGEILIFRGIDPATDFQIVGLFDVSEPAGTRCLAKMGSDLYYYGTQGPEALGKLLGGLGRVDVLGNAIQDIFEERVRAHQGSSIYDMVLYTKDSWIVCNVPITPPSTIHQFTYNLETKAWFRITEWNGNSWVQHDGELYFGDNNGIVHIANYGMNDYGNAIPTDYMANWNSFGTPRLKKFNICKITMRSISKPVPSVAMMTDYKEVNPPFTPEFPQESIETPWDVSPWDTSPWSSSPFFSVDIFGLTDQGYVGAFRYRENVKDSYTQMYGYQITFEEGDFL